MSVNGRSMTEKEHDMNKTTTTAEEETLNLSSNEVKNTKYNLNTKNTKYNLI